MPTSRKLVLSLLFCASGALYAQEKEPVSELERFITHETAIDREPSLYPGARPLEELFGSQAQVAEVPRAITALSSTALEEFGIRSFADLGRVGAGTQQPNYYGVPGSPTLRGAKGSVFFNGMQRAYQRNEMPLSFGSAEAMDIVKGPAPAHFGPGMVGGFVNLTPKTPFFDKIRGSLQLTVGSNDLYQVQADYGGPTLLAGKPAAFRISFTGQLSGSYYDRIRNDYASLYASVKIQAAKDLTIFTGTEIFDFHSNENAGWNRPTQALINEGRYVIGEALDVSSTAWGGSADRNVISKNPALVVPRDVVDAAVKAGTITSAQRQTMNDLSTAEGRLAAYGANSPYLDRSNGGAYQYTPAYFAAGGKVFTQTISGSRVLSDDNDYANARNLLWFFDLNTQRNPALPLKFRTLLDWVKTDKLSTYGYAVSTRQLVLEEKAVSEKHFALLRGMDIESGVSARFTEGKILQDYTLEPFSRRDITRDSVSANSVLLTGPQRGPDGLNLWSPSSQGGANVHSRLWQFSAFLYAKNQLSSRLTLHTSLLAAHAPFRTKNPSEVDRSTAAQKAALDIHDKQNYTNASISPVLKLTEGLNAYLVYQKGTSIDSVQGGAMFGRGNFAHNELEEGGLKADLAKGKLFATLAAFRWEQSQFDARALVPELLRGRGLEVELTARPTQNLTFVASAGWQRVRRLKPLPYRSMPMTEQQWALYGGVFNSQFGPAIFNPTEGRAPAANPDLVYPGSPEFQAKFFARLQLPAGFSIGGGPVFSRAYWHNFDHTLRLPSSVVWNFNGAWTRGAWFVRAEMDNVFSEDYFLGSEPTFGANTLLTKAPGAQGKLSVGWRF